MAHVFSYVSLAMSGYFSILLLYSRTVLAGIYDGINQNAKPWVMSFAEGQSVGPDGPWNFILQAVSFPDQNHSLVPSVSQTSLIVSQAACSEQGSACPLPLPQLWTQSGAYQVSGGPLTQGSSLPASEWDADYTALLGIENGGQHIEERFTLHDSTYGDNGFLDLHGLMLSNNYSVTYPGGASYTMDTGFFSLYGGQQTVNWTATNGTAVSKNRTLPDAYTAGYSPSISYGLHLGSASLNVSGSLVLGGYDSSRCLTTPITSDNLYVSLVDISLNVTSGGSAYTNLTTGYVNGLLRDNGGQASQLDVYPRPGAPYLYLPKDSCAAIASYLPVTYSSELNLYLWNTNDDVYWKILQSPHYLAFTFASSDGGKSTINVPFALLNLTLESPIFSAPTQYFPCRPWDPSVTGYTLGSAFLQAAFLAQNWQTNKLFLAQAPGPNFLPQNVQRIYYTDSTLTPATNPPDWASTWQGVLKPLAGSTNNTSFSSGPNQYKASSDLSGGAIAGIVVGVVVVLAIVAALIFWMSRKRRVEAPVGQSDDVRQQHMQQQQQPYSATLPPQYYNPQHGVGEGHGVPYVEAEAKDAPNELDAQRAVSELPAGDVGAVRRGK